MILTDREFYVVLKYVFNNKKHNIKHKNFKSVNTQIYAHTHTAILCYLDQHFKSEDARENVVKITQHLREQHTVRYNFHL